MKSFCLKLLGVILPLVFLASCSSDTENEARTELTISAAVSMRGALIEIKEEYERENQHVELLFNYGSSGGLAAQIIQGAPVDVYISAAHEPFNRLVAEGKIDEGLVNNLAGNELVLIQNKNSKVLIDSFEQLSRKDIGQIAIGTPESVPAGKYAKEVLEKLGIWDGIRGKLVPTKDVSQVLSYVETGNVDAGIVYKTDGMISDKVTIRSKAQQDLHSPIVYPIGVLDDSPTKDEAEKFFHYLLGEKAQTILKKYGFKEV